MKLHEKIRSLLQERGYRKVSALHRKVQEIFGKEAVTSRSLRRIAAGQVRGSSSSLHQICVALDIQMKDLYAGVDEGMESDHIRRKTPAGRYSYNEKAYVEIFSNDKVDYLLMRLALAPAGKTNLEKDPADKEKSTKLIYVLMGKLICNVEQEKITLKKGDSFCFDSRRPHYFENPTKQKASCIIVQDPRRF